MNLDLYEVLSDKNVDANAESVTESIKVGKRFYVTMYVVGNTGSHTNHIVTIQTSNDNEDFTDTKYSVPGDNHINKVYLTGPYLRAKVTTTQGGSSTCAIYMILTLI